MTGLDISVISHYTRFDLFKFLTVILYFQKNVETYESIPMPTVTQTTVESFGLQFGEGNCNLLFGSARYSPYRGCQRDPKCTDARPPSFHQDTGWFLMTEINLSSSSMVLVGLRCHALQESTTTSILVTAHCTIRFYLGNVRHLFCFNSCFQVNKASILRNKTRLED